jgi:hypothetical protein
MGGRTIAPLVRLRLLGLLGLRSDDSGCLIVTERGSETAADEANFNLSRRS